jgi:hypothetical protein
VGHTVRGHNLPIAEDPDGRRVAAGSAVVEQPQSSERWAPKYGGRLTRTTPGFGPRPRTGPRQPVADGIRCWLDHSASETVSSEFIML